MALRRVDLVYGPPQVTAALVRERVSRLIPDAAIGLAPERATLVNIETVMWVAAPKQRTLPTITILGRNVHITIRLAQVSWNFGDGERDTSPTAGKAYDQHRDPCDAKLCPSYYGHLYVHTGIVQISATATWTATFTVGTGRPVTIPGTVPQPDGHRTDPRQASPRRPRPQPRRALSSQLRSREPPCRPGGRTPEGFSSERAASHSGSPLATGTLSFQLIHDGWTLLASVGTSRSAVAHTTSMSISK